MLRLLLDQDFDHRIIRSLVKRVPNLDFATARSLGLNRANDRALLLRAADEGRILLSHDESTMPDHYFALVNQGKTLEGVFIVPRRLRFRSVVSDLEIIIQCSDHEEWKNDYKILPF